MPEVLKNRYTNSTLLYAALKALGFYKTSLFLLADIEQSIVIGTVALRKKPDIRALSFSWYIYGVAIREEMRGKGLGRVLMEEALREAKGMNIKRIHVVVDGDNMQAKTLYHKLGFLDCQARKSEKARQNLMIKFL